MSLEYDIKEFLGPQGLTVIQKAIKQNNQDKSDMSNLIESLQLFPRAIISWTFNLTKNLAQPIKTQIPSTEYVLSIKKNDGKLDYEIIKKTEVVVKKESVELPSLILNIFDLTNMLDKFEKNFNDNSEDLQKAVDFLVKKFHFEKKISINLNKSETSGTCEDCGQNIKIDENKQKLCVCFKVFGKTLHVKKNDNGSLNVSFSGNWDKQNVFLLMKSLKAKI